MAHVEQKQLCELFQKGRLESKPQFYPLLAMETMGKFCSIILSLGFITCKSICLFVLMDTQFLAQLQT